MDRRWVAGVVALALVGAGLSGCRQESAEPGAPASTTVSTTTRSVTPTPSEDPLFTEAKEVYAKYIEQLVGMSKSGGGDSLPPEMAKLVAGEYASATRNLYLHTKDRGNRATPDSTGRVVSVAKRTPTGTHVTAINGCADLTGVEFVDSAGKRVDRGTLRQDVFELDHRDGLLVITEGTSKKVSQCAE